MAKTLPPLLYVIFKCKMNKFYLDIAYIIITSSSYIHFHPYMEHVSCNNWFEFMPWPSVSVHVQHRSHCMGSHCGSSMSLISIPIFNTLCLQMCLWVWSSCSTCWMRKGQQVLQPWLSLLLSACCDWELKLSWPQHHDLPEGPRPSFEDDCRAWLSMESGNAISVLGSLGYTSWLGLSCCCFVVVFVIVVVIIYYPDLDFLIIITYMNIIIVTIIITNIINDLLPWT